MKLSTVVLVAAGAGVAYFAWRRYRSTGTQAPAITNTSATQADTPLNPAWWFTGTGGGS